MMSTRASLPRLFFSGLYFGFCLVNICSKDKRMGLMGNVCAIDVLVT
jgi:hypothetical protein